jgi:hypothetical protein
LQTSRSADYQSCLFALLEADIRVRPARPLFKKERGELRKLQGLWELRGMLELEWLWYAEGRMLLKRLQSRMLLEHEWLRLRVQRRRRMLLKCE